MNGVFISWSHHWLPPFCLYGFFKVFFLGAERFRNCLTKSWDITKGWVEKGAASPITSSPSFWLSSDWGNTYNFTVLSLRHLSTAMNAELEAPFAPYRAKQHAYDSDLVKPDGVDELVLSPGMTGSFQEVNPTPQTKAIPRSSAFWWYPLVVTNIYHIAIYIYNII